MVISLNCLATGCGRTEPTHQVEPRVHRVSVGELVRVYRNFPNSHRYTGLTIQVYVPVDPSRKFEKGYVDAFKVLESRQGCIRFKTQTELLDPKADLVITGLCKGMVRDGVYRSPGVDWYIMVEDCKVTQVYGE